MQFSVPRSPNDHWDCCCFHSHVFSISISRSLYLVSFSIVFKGVFLSVGIDISMFGLFAFIFLSVWIGMSQSVVAAWFSHSHKFQAVTLRDEALTCALFLFDC